MVAGSSADAIYNDPALTRRVRAAVDRQRSGPASVVSAEPIMASEDFSQYGRTVEKVPICFFMLGASDPRKLDGEPADRASRCPSLHSSQFAPVPEPTIQHRDRGHDRRGAGPAGQN